MGSPEDQYWNLEFICILVLEIWECGTDTRHPSVCPKEVTGVPSLLLITDESLHASCTPIADFYLLTFNNDRHFPHTLGHFEHFLELFTVVSDVYVSGFVSVSRPGFVCVGSTGFAIKDYFVCHLLSSFSHFRFRISDFRLEKIKHKFRTESKFHNPHSAFRNCYCSNTPVYSSLKLSSNEGTTTSHPNLCWISSANDAEASGSP